MVGSSCRYLAMNFKRSVIVEGSVPGMGPPMPGNFVSDDAGRKRPRCTRAAPATGSGSGNRRVPVLPVSLRWTRRPSASMSQRRRSATSDLRAPVMASSSIARRVSPVQASSTLSRATPCGPPEPLSRHDPGTAGPPPLRGERVHLQHEAGGEMAFRRVSVDLIREVLRRWKSGEGMRTVAAATLPGRRSIERGGRGGVDVPPPGPDCPSSPDDPHHPHGRPLFCSARGSAAAQG